MRKEQTSANKEGQFGEEEFLLSIISKSNRSK